MTTALSLATLMASQAESTPQYAYVHQNVASGTDVLVSAPVNNKTEVELTVTSKSGSTLNFVNSPAFATGAYNAGTFPKYYVRFIDGPAAGLWASITVNSETSITIDNSSVATLVANGNKFRVVKHNTVGSVFPASLAGTAYGDGAQLLFYSTANAQNKAPGSGGIVNFTTFFDIGWGANADRPILPEEAFVIRNSTGSAITYVAAGLAPDSPVAYLVTNSVTKDTPLGTGYPVGVTVAETGLGTVNGRRILLQTTAQNAPAGSLANYLYTAGSWGANTNVVLAPNTGFIFRQQAGQAGGKATVTKPY